ncbi:MAG: ATP/GTP-binding protein [Actinobacteria bacterium]|nr:ATP/GTP-binding protein [Actinomycetota bacterium]
MHSTPANTPDPAALGRRLAARDRTAAPAALNVLELTGERHAPAAAALLAEVAPDKLGGEAPGMIVGVTGPPGAGKSTLLSELVAKWRERGKSVAVLAIDPSSKRSGGSLLGDRARIRVTPGDSDVLIRSTATATRLGGLAPATREAAFAMAAAFDVVIVETVGVGQSETDIAELADTTIVIVQPASGDVLQFIKSGVMEVPDLLVVTKADLGAPAMRAARELEAAVKSIGSNTPILQVSSLPPSTGVDDLIDAVETHHAKVDLPTRRAAARRAAALDAYAHEYGESGLRAIGGRRAAEQLLLENRPSTGLHTLLTALEEAR